MRHNLLIVDDEELIRQGLKARLEYLKIEVDEVFEAANGTEALKILGEHPVDVVVTDIRMPDMNGLTLIEEMQKIKKELQFVVLSGYAEFAYAETAIRLGVKAYLLKPLSNEELKSTFEKLYEEMEHKVQVRQVMRMEKMLSREKEEYLLEKRINAFIAGAVGEVSPAEMGLDPAESRCLFLAVIDVEPESYNGREFEKKDHEMIRFSVKNVFEEAKVSCGKIIVSSLSDYHQLYAVFWGYEEKRVRGEIERQFLKMRSVLEKKMEIYLTFGVSRATEKLGKETVREAYRALQQKVVYGASNLYFFEDIRILIKEEFPASKMYLLNQYMERNEVMNIRRLLEDIFSEELVRKYGMSYLRIMWVRILNMLFGYYDSKADGRAEARILLANYNFPDQVNSVGEIRQRITDIVMECVQWNRMPELNAKSRIQMAVQYIQEHYNENIAINDLAERYEMSPNYFSSIFKKEMNQSTVNYITRLRMEKARELLEKSYMSVADIARKVGYEDGQYFFRVFKKYTGMPPLKYREKNQK